MNARGLVLSRRSGEAIWIGDDIRIVIGDMDRGAVKVIIDAPESFKILREELKRDESKTS